MVSTAMASTAIARPLTSKPRWSTLRIVSPSCLDNGNGSTHSHAAVLYVAFLLSMMSAAVSIFTIAQATISRSSSTERIKDTEL